MSSETPKLLTVDQVADLLQVKPLTVWKLVEKGLITPLRFNRRLIRFHPNELELCLKKLAANSNPSSAV